MARVSGDHHPTMSTDGAQEDFDFYTKALGLHSVERTVLFDGAIPVCLRAHIEGPGFTDISEQNDRNYFKSCYFRSPGGALFEFAWTTPEGWAKDEPPGRIGKTRVFPPWFKDREDEPRSGLEEANFA